MQRRAYKLIDSKLNVKMEEKKRKRCPNFSPDDKSLLVTLATQFGDIIENKRTDAVTWRAKEKCWEGIANLYNVHSKVPRTAQALRKYYVNLKAQTRRRDLQKGKNEKFMKKSVPNVSNSDKKIMNDTSEVTSSPVDREIVTESINDHIKVENFAEAGHLRTDNLSVITLDEEDIFLEHRTLTPDLTQEKHVHPEISNLPFLVNHYVDWYNFKTELLKSTGKATSSKEVVPNSEWQSSKRSHVEEPQTINSQQIAQNYAQFSRVKLEYAKLQFKHMKEEMELRKKMLLEEHEAKLALYKMQIRFAEKQLYNKFI